MKVDRRGRVTIPKEIRVQCGLEPATEVSFQVSNGKILLRRTPQKLNLLPWKGYCNGSLERLGFSSADDFIGSVRGR